MAGPGAGQTARVLLADAGMTAAALLAALLAWAGTAKLQRAEATRLGFAALGIPQPERAAVAVPLAELAIAVLLLALPPAGAALALLLLGAFTWVLVTRVRAGVAVPCACFGQPHAPPLSWLEVGRNACLVVLAALALAAGRAHVPGLRGVLIATGLAVLALAVLSYLRTRLGLDTEGRLGPDPTS